MNIQKFIFPFGETRQLAGLSTAPFKKFADKTEAKEKLKKGKKKLSDMQTRLYAQNQQSLLIIFQAMDAAGKDSTIKHVMSGVNPQGCNVTSFKSPSAEELDHNYLWRCMKETPAKGNIRIFNRSYYEEVLVVKVHPEFLAAQKLQDLAFGELPDERFWMKRYHDINNFEEYLTNNGTHILKFFLNVSKEEQKARFLKRIETPEKNWKFTMNDVTERKYWDDYQSAYEQMMLNTSTEIAPWHVIPADEKWFMQMAVNKIIVKKLKSLDLRFPELSEKQLENLQMGKEMLMKE